MDIVEHGKSYKNIRCFNCDCMFNYIKSDIKIATWDEDYYEYVKCPECRKIIKIEEILL